MINDLAVPAFLAGILTFLAPCTLPLIPAFLGMMGGAATHVLREQGYSAAIKRKIFFNGLFFVIGFSLIFIALGILFGFVGSAFVKYRDLLSRIGGVFVMIFGLYLLGAIHLRFLEITKKIPLPKMFKPGSTIGSVVMGATFGLGWTPCIGPILASVLFLASTTSTAVEGGILLLIFSAGLAIPFLLLALLASHASQFVHSFTRALKWTQIIGGAFLLLLGILLVTDSFDTWVRWLFKIFHFIQYEKLLNYF